MDSLVCSVSSKKSGGGDPLLKNAYLGEICPHLDMEIWYFFLNGREIVKLGLDGDNFLA